MKNFKNIFGLFIIFLIFCFVINMVEATDITINNTNSTLKDVVNKYDTIYLEDGVYNGSMNKNINVTKNTTIIGLHKNSAVIDVGYGELFRVNQVSLTLINLTIRNGYGTNLISNFGSLNISNTNFVYNLYGSAILTTGSLTIVNSSFKDGSCAINTMYYNQRISIANTEFVNNEAGGVLGLIHVSGFNKTLNFNNLTFVNNTAYNSLISIMAESISLNLQNSSFINNTIGSLDFLYIDGPFGPPSVPNKKNLKNIVELGTIANIKPYIDLGVYLKTNNLLILKASLKKFGEVLPNKKLYFYVNGKHVGSAVTNKNGVATFTIKRSNLNFNVQVSFNKLTEKTSSKTLNYNAASFKGKASKFVVGNPKIIFKLKNTKKKGVLIYKKYYIQNNGNSFGTKTFMKKIPSKYKLVKYSSKKLAFKYKLSTKTYTVKVTNQLPYKFNKKNVGVLTLVLRKK
jgi:hypothetical protein